MWLIEPAKLQSEEGQVRPMCDDKNCQSTKCVNMWPVKPVMDVQSTESSNTIQLQEIFV